MPASSASALSPFDDIVGAIARGNADAVRSAASARSTTLTAEAAADCMTAAALTASQDIVAELLRLSRSHTRWAALAAPSVLYKGLRAAAEMGCDDVVRALVEAGAPVNAPTAAETDGAPPLLWAVRHRRLSSARLLLAAGADPTWTGPVSATADTDGTTVLIAAVRTDHDDMVACLLQAGAAVDLSDTSGFTPLMRAAALGNTSVLRRLLAAGADPNQTSAMGVSALMHAANQHHPQALSVLLAAGANPTSVDHNGRTAFTHALTHSASGAAADWTLLTLLQRGGCPVPTGRHLMEAAAGGHRRTVQRLLALGCDPNATNASDATALMQAAAEGHLDVVRLLLASGALCDARDRNGATALWHAFSGPADGMEAVVTVLLEAGADPTIPTNNGKTVLMLGGSDTIRARLQAAIDRTTLTWAAAPGGPARPTRVM